MICGRCGSDSRYARLKNAAGYAIVKVSDCLEDLNLTLHESAEMYIETIYRLAQESNYVRSIDVAESMGYSKPSVSRAVNLLKQGGYLLMDKDGFLTLTEQGRSVAQKVYERHTLLTRLLVSLGVDEKIAAEDACRIEHVISDESFAAVKARFGDSAQTQTEGRTE